MYSRICVGCSKRAGHRVVTAENLHDGLILLKTMRPTVVVMGAGLHAMHGTSSAEEFHRRLPSGGLVVLPPQASRLTMRAKPVRLGHQRDRGQIELAIAECRSALGDRRHGRANDVPAFLHTSYDAWITGGDAAGDLVRLARLQDLLERSLELGELAGTPIERDRSEPAPRKNAPTPGTCEICIEVLQALSGFDHDDGQQVALGVERPEVRATLIIGGGEAPGPGRPRRPNTTDATGPLRGEPRKGG